MQGFHNHCTWVEIALPMFPASNSSSIFYRPYVPFPMYCMRSTAWVCSLSQDSCSSTTMTQLPTVLAAGMMMLRYHRANYSAAFWCMIAAIAPLACLLAFINLLMAVVRCWKSALLMTHVISWSNLLGAGKLLSLLRLRRPAAMLHAVIDVRPRLAGTFRLWVQGSTVYHHWARVGVGFGFSLCFSSGFCLSCNFSLGFSFGCCCSWRFSDSPYCVVPACCKASRPPPSHLAVSFLPFFSLPGPVLLYLLLIMPARPSSCL
jgi:hypothetical protein